ncbi:MAG: 2-C-methyl-D-erythritol 4-phosphate cytidylyltransferase [Clostridia bacterium]|nr:2-C-methyl-D-erythritol 4-phosphate cytidylyltransferase [Clostridia bacterium]
MSGAVGTIIVAAGKGRRVGSDVPKQYLRVAGRPVLAWSLIFFEQRPEVESIVVVIAPEDADYCREVMLGHNFTKVAAVVPGGETRQQSVLNGLFALPASKSELVAVHDAARPFLDGRLFERLVRAGREFGAAVPALPVRETLKATDPEGFVRSTVPRDSLVATQTPQIFDRELLSIAHLSAREEGFQGTDDASLVEHLGWKVKVVPGDPRNIKITYPEDIVLAEAFLAASE